MGPRKPEVEYISLNKLAATKNSNVENDKLKEAYKSLEKLANNSLKSDSFSITKGKTIETTAPSGDVRDFLSYAPYFWPENPNDPDTKYIRKDGKRNPDSGSVKDQSKLEGLTENLTFLCLGYYFFNNDDYAKKVVSLLDEFFINENTRMNPNLNYAQFVRGSQNKTQLGRGEGVISSRGLARVVNVLPLLDGFHAYESIKDNIVNWFSQYLNWLKTSSVALEAARAKNNIFTWYTVQLVAISQFLDPNSTEISDLITKFFKTYLPLQIDSKSGDQPLESKRAKSFHYLAFNLQAVIFLAQIGKDLGIAVYSSTNLVDLGMHNMTVVAQTCVGEDITVGVRCAEIISSEIEHALSYCLPYIENAYNCEFSEKLGGNKNAISALWT